MEENILKYSPTVMFRGAPCTYLYVFRNIAILQAKSMRHERNNLSSNKTSVILSWNRIIGRSAEMCKLNKLG